MIDSIMESGHSVECGAKYENGMMEWINDSIPEFYIHTDIMH